MRYSNALVILLLLTSPASAGDEQYVLGADSKRKEGTPVGEVTSAGSILWVGDHQAVGECIVLE